jgi:hypothetical protein
VLTAPQREVKVMYRSSCSLGLLVLLSGNAWSQPSPTTAPSRIADIPVFDAAVARRAAALISSPRVWTRDDGADCRVGATSFGLRCALQRATEEAAQESTALAPRRDETSRPLAACTVRREGSCGPLFDDFPVLFAVEKAKAVTSGVWRTDMHPSEVWVGKMADALQPVMQQARRLVDSIAHENRKTYSARLIDYNNDSSRTFADVQGFVRALESRLAHQNAADLTQSPDDFELEIYPGATGVIRTYSGWFAVSAFSHRDSTLRFQIDTSRQVAPTSVDREILRRANEMLSSDSVWNRADNRVCPAGARSWSIYCALHDASVAIAGGFHHRRPALEIVRVIVEARTKDKKYGHRLMGYNNDPATRLSDIKSLFAEALAQAQ